MKPHSSSMMLFLVELFHYVSGSMMDGQNWFWRLWKGTPVRCFHASLNGYHTSRSSRKLGRGGLGLSCEYLSKSFRAGEKRTGLLRIKVDMRGFLVPLGCAVPRRSRITRSPPTPHHKGSRAVRFLSACVSCKVGNLI